MIEKHCLHCNKIFKTYPSTNRVKYCSKQCYFLSMEGKEYTKERNDKISNSMKNKVFTENHIENLSKSAKLRKQKYGEEAPNWQGGLTKLSTLIRGLEQYNNWRLLIYKRDSFICQGCKNVGGELNAHHIKHFAIIVKENNIKTLTEAIHCNELWNLDNGVTLCKKCHNKIHHGEQDDVKYKALCTVEIKDGEADDIELDSVELR